MVLRGKPFRLAFLTAALIFHAAPELRAQSVSVADLPDAQLFDTGVFQLVPGSSLVTVLSDAFDQPLDESDAVLRPRARLRVTGPPDRVLLAYSFSNGAANPAGRSIPPIGLAVYETGDAIDERTGGNGLVRSDDWMLTPAEGGVPHGVDSVRLVKTPDGAVLRMAGPSLSISLDDRTLSRGQTLLPLSAAGLPAGPGITLPAEARLAPGGIYGNIETFLGDGDDGPMESPVLTLSVLPAAAAADATRWPAILVATDKSGTLPEDWQGTMAIPIDLDPTSGALTAPDDQARQALAELGHALGPDLLSGAGLILPDLLQRGEAIAMIGAPDRQTGILDRIGPQLEQTGPDADGIEGDGPEDTPADPPALAAVELPPSLYQPPRQRAVCERLRWNEAAVAAHILGEGRLTDWLARITHVAAADPMGRVRVTMNLCPGSTRTVAVPVEIPADDAARLLSGPRVGMTRLTGVPTRRQSSPGVGIRALSATVPTS